LDIHLLNTVVDKVRLKILWHPSLSRQTAVGRTLGLLLGGRQLALLVVISTGL
jgi:hypothetical protein